MTENEITTNLLTLNSLLPASATLARGIAHRSEPSVTVTDNDHSVSIISSVGLSNKANICTAIHTICFTVQEALLS